MLNEMPKTSWNHTIGRRQLFSCADKNEIQISLRVLYLLPRFWLSFFFFPSPLNWAICWHSKFCLSALSSSSGRFIHLHLPPSITVWFWATLEIPSSKLPSNTLMHISKFFVLTCYFMLGLLGFLGKKKTINMFTVWNNIRESRFVVQIFCSDQKYWSEKICNWDLCSESIIFEDSCYSAIDRSCSCSRKKCSIWKYS